MLFVILYFNSNKLHLSAPNHSDLVYSELADKTKAILLTDLCLAGFEPGNSSCGNDVATVELLVNYLAKFHALSYDYIQSNNDMDLAVLHDSVPMANRKLNALDGLSELLQNLQPLSEDYSTRITSLFSSEAYFEMCR